MLHGKALESYCIGRRVTAKARAPLATAAKNALQKATAKLIKKHGGDSLMVIVSNSKGDQINGSQASLELQRGNAVTLCMYHTIREPIDWLDQGEGKVIGEIVVTLQPLPQPQKT